MATAIQPQDTGMDLQQAQAIAALPPDLMLLKMENESIMSVARAQPRDPMKIVEQLQQLIDAYPQSAEEAIYCKPVGTVHQLTCAKCGIKYEVVKIDKDTCCTVCGEKKHTNAHPVKKFAEGLSIRAAESIRSIYGYTRLATTTELLEDGRAKITGVIVDYAAGNLTSDERIVSPYYKSREGGMVRTPEDRFLNVTVKAEKSKLRRDVILDNTPGIIKAMFRSACEDKMRALVKPEVIDQKVIPAFADYGITPAHLDKLVGRPHKLGWREEERLELRKILNALKNEETTARELLEGLDASDLKSKPAPQPSGPVTADALAGAAAETHERPEPKAASRPDEAPQPEPDEAAQPEPGSLASIVAGYQRGLERAASVNAVNGVVGQIIEDPDLDVASREALLEKAKAREETIRASRGPRSNTAKTTGGKLFETRPTAASQGQ
ncbi:MAG: hypothetical protein JW809_19510 [Pirellulales bacterium]|nr:hypothetical protein [Pirellulales bacterium]